jgi:hypothetical protein
VLRRLQAIVGGCLLLFSVCCRPARILTSPVPDQIKNLQGYASLSMKSEGGSSRSKFSFLLVLPDQGRIDVTDFLGRALYQIIIDRGSAYLVIPSKRVYWQGVEEAVIEKFLGFPVALEEMISIFSGRWPVPEKDGMKFDPWVLEKDERGRVLSGQREDLRFMVEEFIAETHIIRRLVFEHPHTQGNLKITRIDFNQLYRAEAFNLGFLSKFVQKTWPEIQELLSDTD